MMRASGARRLFLLQLAAAGLPLARAAPAGDPLPAGLSFPRDYGAHPETRIEWWYLTGLLSRAGAAQPDFGYQLTFFRRRGPAPEAHPSTLAARQILLAHAALSDLRPGGRLRHDQRMARSVPGLNEAALDDCRLRLQDWSLRRLPGSGPDRYEAALRSRSAGFALRLQLQASQAPLLQGEQGLSRKGPQPDQFSHYYSQTQLRGEALLSLDGQEQTLQGLSWLDHEWSGNLLGTARAEAEPAASAAAAAAEQAIGWDWAGINLLDGGALTVFQLRRADGSRLWAGGSWRQPDGRALNLQPEQLSLRPLRHWTSPASGAVYPVEWLLRTPQGEQLLRSLLDAQEVDARASTGMRYWEGASELLDGAGRRSGLGYLELTGYAGPLRLL